MYRYYFRKSESGFRDWCERIYYCKELVSDYYHFSDDMKEYYKDRFNQSKIIVDEYKKLCESLNDTQKEILKEYYLNNKTIPWSISTEDKKTIYIDCDFGSSTSSKECTTTVGVANLSTFNVELSADPNVEFDSLLIKEVEVKWVSDGEPNSVEEDVAGGFVLEQNITKELVIRILSNDLTVEMLPSTELVIPISISFDWHQTDK